MINISKTLPQVFKCCASSRIQHISSICNYHSLMIRLFSCFLILIFSTSVSANNTSKDIILKPKAAKHDNTLIWLHGLGDSAYGFLDLFDSNQSFVTDQTKVVLLTSPERAVTINGGAVMTSWYDIKSFDKDGLETDRISFLEVEDSYKIVKHHLDEEIKLLGGDSSKVFLGGFSQGCAMSLYSGLVYEKTLGGLIGLSGYFFEKVDTDCLSPDRKQMPIYIAHGEWDDVVPFSFAKQGYERLLRDFQNSSFNPEPRLPHSINLPQLMKLKKWYQNQTQK